MLLNLKIFRVKCYFGTYALNLYQIITLVSKIITSLHGVI
jgi:hypothetical protein